MKKIGIVALIGLCVLAAGIAAAYFFLNEMPGITAPVAPTETVVTVSNEVSFKGKLFSVPPGDGLTTTLDLLSPTTRRDYPMGRYQSADGLVQGTLVVLDEFVSSYENNIRAVPIAVNEGGSGEFFYLAVLEGDDMRHATSLPLGDRIKITSVMRAGDQVTVNYNIHDRNQAMAEAPSVSTTAIIDIATGVVVQAGRNPATETVIVTKNFTGAYLWVDTTYTDGKVVKPVDPKRFMLTFDANRLVLETDCNTGGATFTAGAGTSTVFTVDAIAATKMFCQSNQESEYFAMFTQVREYTESLDGTLTLSLVEPTGSMTFSPKMSVLEFDSTPTTADPAPIE